MAMPKLRFKEFESDLINYKLIDLTIWSSGGTPSKSNCLYWGGEIPLISAVSMHKERIIDADVRITDLGLKDGSRIAPENSVLILVRGSMLFKKIPIGIVLRDVAFNQDVKCITPKSKLNSNFLFQWTLSKENIILNKVSYTGIGAGKLETSDLQNLRIKLPELKEQIKIANFLSAVDEKINQLSQKVELLTQYKQGMMQNLFSQQIRFKADDGSEFGEWESTLLGNVTEIIGGGTPSTSNSEFWDGNIPWLTPSDITNKFIDNSKRKISEIAISKSSAKVLPVGTVLFTTRATIGLVAISTCEVTTNQGFQSFVVKSSLFNEFLYYWLLGSKKLFIELSTGSTFLEINKSTIRVMQFFLPSFSEQTKIANFLSSIDQKIDLTEQQLEQAKEWKKGLLQQMFI